jgi:hypothetical protein
MLLDVEREQRGASLEMIRELLEDRAQRQAVGLWG